MAQQKQIESKFNKLSTATDVLEGLPLSNKVALITGGHSGLGLEATKALSCAGVHVVVAARNIEIAAQNLKDLNNITILPLDLSNIPSIKTFAQIITANCYKFDIVLCNAGIMACSEQRVASGWEAQFATNHVGHYLLVNLLWNNIRSGARVICVSSAGHHNFPIRWNDIQFITGYDKWLAYGQSKTANALFALQLDNYAKKHDIRSFSLHPGKIFTPLQRYLTNEEMVKEGWIDSNGNPIDPTFKSTAQGAATVVWAATSPELNGLGGLYCEDCNIASLSSEPFIGVCDYAIDTHEALKLWKFTANLTGVNIFSNN